VDRGSVRIGLFCRVRQHCRYVHTTSYPINVAHDHEAEAVVDDQPRPEVDAGLFDIVDGGDVAQEEHGLLIEVYDHAGIMQRPRGFWFISNVSRGQRSIA
jgi:hypothetical protein